MKHRSRVRQDPTQPNLRQVHLIHEELHDELRASGFAIGPGTMGENITTRGVDLLACPPAPACAWGKRPGRADRPAQSLLATGQLPARTDRRRARPRRTGNLIRKAGVMAIVLEDGEFAPATPSISSCHPCRTGPGEGLRQSAAIPGELCARACVPMLASTAQPQGVTACTSSHWRHCS
ncbi:hypothetical protein CSC43_6946 [Pseudomonas aeruginosa]|nr:hypothetical protein CSC43_6946 [Pseudomonas aeruginosa]